MSIYTARLTRPIDTRNSFARSGLQECATGSPSPGRDHVKRRQRQPANYLLPESIDWLERLQAPVRPVVLATRFPRIVNRLASGWEEPATTCRNFDELVYDRRGNRKGFPTDVHRDLLTLRDYYFGCDPNATR